MSNIDKRPYRADGGDIGTGRIKEIADNPYGDEEKCWLAKRVLALLDGLERANTETDKANSLVDELRKERNFLQDLAGKRQIELEAAEKRITELEARDINIKQQAQALFEAIANPSEHYVPAYARCLREALNGTGTAKGE